MGTGPDEDKAARAPRTRCSVKGGVAEVRLNRPEKLNAFDRDMFASLAADGARLAADPDVRAVVISGEGRAFSAGLDLASFAAGLSDSLGADLTSPVPGSPANQAQMAVWAWKSLEVPVIAAVHGPALGAGLQLALGADIRIVAPDASLSVMEVRWGLVPDMAGTHLLPRLVGTDRAKELTWTGRKVSGDEAVRIGLATMLADDPRAAALELAARLASSSPDAIRHAKRLIDASLEREPAAQLADEAATMAALLRGANHREAVSAGFEQRAPVFSPPAGS